MFITNDFVFLELPKTGSTHILRVLEKVYDDYRIIGKHNTYERVFKNHDINSFKSKVKFGTVRNPWEWYVSNWAFGCMQKGGLYKRCVKHPNLLKRTGINIIRRRTSGRLPIIQDLNKWKEVYSDVNDTSKFRKWLRFILETPKMDLGDDYKRNRISNEVGFVTYLFVRLYTYNGRNAMRKLKNYDDIISHFSNNYFLDFIIRNESLNKDLIQNFINYNVADEEITEIINNLKTKTNKSKHLHYTEYYDDYTMKLVEEKDKLLIDKFSYRF